MIKEKVLSALPKGHEFAKTTSELSRILNLDKRSINQIIATLRIDGVPIIGSATPPFGLFIAKTPQELNAFIKQETNRADSTKEMLKKLQENLQKEYFNV